MKKKNIKLILIIFAGIYISGCAMRRPVPTAETEEGLDRETRQKIEKILKTVSKKAKKKSLNGLGRSTMKESVDIMDLGSPAAVFLVEKIKKTDNWKMRYWLVDMLGYIENKNSILPLVEIIEDTSENDRVRIRACESLKELNYRESVEKLGIALELVENTVIKEKILDTINAIR